MIRRAVAACLLVLLSGCTAVVDGTGGPIGSSPAATTFVPTLAPRVPEPRDVRDVAPCDLLTTEQEDAIGVDRATETETVDQTVQACRWRTSDGEGVVGVVGVQNPPAGLEGLYMLRDVYDVFEPGELDGFPIVYGQLVADENGCRIYLGVADDQMLQSSAGFLNISERDACAVARQMASFMIANLPPPR